MNTHRHREANRITAVIAAVCTTACATAVVPGLEHTITTTLLTLAALAVTAVSTRWALRWVTDRREDRADALTVALWRTEHTPHRLDHTDRAALARHHRHTHPHPPGDLSMVEGSPGRAPRTGVA